MKFPGNGTGFVKDLQRRIIKVIKVIMQKEVILFSRGRFKLVLTKATGVFCDVGRSRVDFLRLSKI